jgi:hypothetical protein
MENIKKALMLMTLCNMFTSGVSYKYYETLLEDARKEFKA